VAETIRMLLADDSPAIVRVLSGLFGSQGFVVTTAGDGAHAMRLLKAQEFDIVFADAHLPGTSGFEMVKTARRIRPDCVVILAAARADFDAAVRGLHAGAFDIVDKEPLDVHRALAAVHRAVEQQRQRAMTTVVRAAQAVFGTRDVEHLPQAIVDVTREIFNAERAEIRAPAASGFEVTHFSGKRSRSAALLKDDVLAACVARNGPLRLPADRLDRDLEPLELTPEIGAIVFPLAFEDEVLALLCVFRGPDVPAFSRSDVDRAMLVAAQATLALGNLRLVRTLRDQIAAVKDTRKRLSVASSSVDLSREAVKVAKATRRAQDVVALRLEALSGWLDGLQDAVDRAVRQGGMTAGAAADLAELAAISEAREHIAMASSALRTVANAGERLGLVAEHGPVFEIVRVLRDLAERRGLKLQPDPGPTLGNARLAGDAGDLVRGPRRPRRARRRRTPRGNRGGRPPRRPLRRPELRPPRRQAPRHRGQRRRRRARR
jgi:DNA-binding response OmpR family regulator